VARAGKLWRQDSLDGGIVALKFEWDINKASSNEKKHGVTFEEASTVLSDFLSITIPDPLHPTDEERLVTIGQSDKQRTLVVVHTERSNFIRLISARLASAHERKSTKRIMASQNDPDMLDEYDFSGGVRGKYAKRYKEGTNLVRLDDDVAAMFPTSEEVNTVLRFLGEIIRRHENSGLTKSSSGRL
jgi:hypothetical protein